MAYICLLLSGAALLVNGIAALGQLPRRDAATFSLVIGSIQVVLAFAYLSAGQLNGAGFTSPAPSVPALDAPAAFNPVLLTSAGMVLFGLTYVYVGLDALLGLGSRGLGWFCGMVAMFGLLLAGAWLSDDPLLAVLWLCWSVLWGLFFASMALGMAGLGPFIGWSLILTSQATASVPAFLGMVGLWPRSPLAAVGAAVLLSGLFFVAGALARRTQTRPNAVTSQAPSQQTRT